MRDITRIVTIIGKILKLWSTVPDWRLGQLISNALSEVGIDLTQTDIFYIEDNLLEKGLDILKEKMKGNK